MPDKFALIQQEGILWGIRGTPSRCTYLTDSIEVARKYGSVVLAVEFDPETDVPNNYCDGCWQCRVYAPIPLSRCKEKAMRKKKEVKKVEYEEIGHASMWGGVEAIPEGATHFELEMDYSNVYYESDSPGCKVHFFKVKE